MSFQPIIGSRTLRVLVCAVILAATGSVSARQNSNQAAQGRSGNSEGVIYRGVLAPSHFDVSPPLRDIPDIEPTMQRVRIEEIETRTGRVGPQDVDQLVQQDVDAAAEIPATSANFNAFDGNGPVPPDPVGDVGLTQYVAMANTRYAVYSKAGALQLGPININTLWAGFGGPCQAENAGDPVVIYDQLANRWVLMQFTADGPTFFVCLAISTTADATGAYFRYSIGTGTNFPDYPKISMWPNAYVVTTREFSSAGPFAGVGVYGLNRSQALAGAAGAQIISFLATPGGTPYRMGDGLLPADLDGTRLPPAGSPAYLVGSQDNGGPYGAPSDALNLWKFNPNFATPASSTLALTNTIPVAAFDSILNACGGTRNCIPQPGTAQRIDHQGYRQRLLHRLAYRNHGTHESLVSNQSVEVSTAPSMSGIRWYEVRRPNAAPFIHQQGTYGPGTTDGIHRWFGSVAQDQNGNMALGYSVSNATAVFPGMRYTGRLVTDALGTLPQGEGTIVNGSGSQTSTSARWGDYTSMNVDPTDDCTFWYVNEYFPVTSSFAWRLRVGSFRFPQCGTPHANITSLWPVGTVRPGQTARLWARVHNDGSVALPADARVWFLSNVPGVNTWVGNASVAGLAPGASAWYFYDYVIPANAITATRSYWAQVWRNAGALSTLAGPQTFNVDRRTIAIDSQWSVTGAYPGATVRLWALVRNIYTTQPADARVYFWVSGHGDVGSTSIAGLPAGQSRWYFFDWVIPAAATQGTRTYWVQGRRPSGVISDWRGPQEFALGFNFPFTTSIAGWTAVTGAWSHQSGAFLYTPGLANVGSSVSRGASFRYLDYQVRLWRSGCQSCANRIMVRGTPAPLNATNQWSSNIMFQYSANGMFSVFKNVGGVSSTLQTWTQSPAVLKGSAWNLLRVVSYEDTFLFYINGILVWAGTDATLPAAGQVGIGMFRDDSAGNGFWVDSAVGIPTGTGTEGAELAGRAPTDRVSEAQLRLNAEANAQPRGTVDTSR
ncbi:MAG: hypothetical protein ACRD1U_16765 [Vicinamibacterales bacterium]